VKYGVKFAIAVTYIAFLIGNKTQWCGVVWCIVSVWQDKHLTC